MCQELLVHHVFIMTIYWLWSSCSQEELNKWLSKEFQKLKLSGKNTVLKDAETLTKILKDLESHLTVAIDVTTMDGALFRAASCGYFDCLAKALDEKVSKELTNIFFTNLIQVDIKFLNLGSFKCVEVHKIDILGDILAWSFSVEGSRCEKS